MEKITVKFSHHAKGRMVERGLDREKLADLCEAVAPMLRMNQALRFGFAGHVIVAQKRPNNEIEVVTAWQKRR